MTARKGLGVYDAVLIGHMLNSLIVDIQASLLNNINQSIIYRNAKEIVASGNKSLWKSAEPDDFKLDRLQENVDNINKRISEVNEILTILNFKGKVESLDFRYIMRIVRDRDRFFADKESMQSADENLRLKLSAECRRVGDSISAVLGNLEITEQFDGVAQLPKDYKLQITEAININSMGYPETAVLCAGRTIEDMVNSCLESLSKIGKITEAQLKEKLKIKYSDKLGFLKQNFLTEEEFFKLKAFSFDRNKGGHADVGSISPERARTLISSSIWLLIDLQKKLEAT